MKNSKTIVYLVPLTSIFAMLCWSFIRVESKDSRPNILLIVSEDHGQHLSCYGDTVINTPNLDKLAADGFLFKNAYITDAVCSPSRSTILSGLYPHQSGHLGLTTHGFHYVGEITTIYRQLKNAGYRTGMIGKLHVEPASFFPIDYHPLTSANYNKTELSRYSEYTNQFIKDSDEPFFLMVNLPDAHWPFQDVVEDRPANPVTPEKVTVFPYIGVDNERIRSYTSSIYNCILRLDETVGEIMNVLHDSGKADNTLVIYLSDHGDEMARGKFDIYEAGTKVPFLVSWPDVIKKGQKSNVLVSAIDIVPTILDAVGLEVADNRVTGKSLLPFFRDPNMAFRDYLFTEKNGTQKRLYFPRRAVRDQRYKLIYSLPDDRKNEVGIRYTANEGRSAALGGSPTLNELKYAPDAIKEVYSLWIDPPKILLYDLDNDPWEFRDLSSDLRYQEVKERLYSALVQWQLETNDPLMHPEKLAQLSAEMDTITVTKHMKWRYPEYLYDLKQ